jgi:hypothetical protein
MPEAPTSTSQACAFATLRAAMPGSVTQLCTGIAQHAGKVRFLPTRRKIASERSHSSWFSGHVAIKLEFYTVWRIFQLPLPSNVCPISKHPFVSRM